MSKTIADFQLSIDDFDTSLVHIYVIKDSLNPRVKLVIQQHGVEPSHQHQAVMEVNDLIAFGELCITLGKLYLTE